MYHIKPSLCYYISNLYKQKGICQENHRIVVQDGELHPVVLEYFTEVAGLEKIEYDLHFKIDWDDDINAKIQSLADNGIVLPALHNDTLTFHYSQYDLNSQDSDPSFEVTRIKRILKYYFSSCKIDFSYFFIISNEPSVLPPSIIIYSRLGYPCEITDKIVSSRN